MIEPCNTLKCITYLPLVLAHSSTPNIDIKSKAPRHMYICQAAGSPPSLSVLSCLLCSLPWTSQTRQTRVPAPCKTTSLPCPRPTCDQPHPPTPASAPAHAAFGTIATLVRADGVTFSNPYSVHPITKFAESRVFAPNLPNGASPHAKHHTRKADGTFAQPP